MDPLASPALWPLYAIAIAVALYLAWRFGRAAGDVDHDDAQAAEAQADGFSTQPPEQRREMVTIRMPAVSPDALGLNGRVIRNYWEKREAERWVLFLELEWDAPSRYRTRQAFYVGGQDLSRHPLAPPGPDPITLVCVQLPGTGEAQLTTQGAWSVARTQEWAFASRRTDEDGDFRATLADARAAIERALAEPAAQPLQPVRGR